MTALPALHLAGGSPPPRSSTGCARSSPTSCEEVNQIILDKMQSEVSLIPELARHIIAAGGKRVRPILTLLSARLCGYRGTRQLGLAACVEFIHTATLLHDDVVDDSGLRRGSATANAVWGNKAPVLVGDFLFSRAFQLMVADGNLRVLAILSNASAVIAEGEVQQLITANDTSSTEAGLSRGDLRQDRRAVPGRLPDRRRGRRAAGGRGGGAGRPTATIWASPSS